MNILDTHRKTVTVCLGILCVAPLFFSNKELWDTCSVGDFHLEE